uniref:Uncharacterized protein n=1 Tax=mine drainage metagenome TaxID=410659 RepID=E6QNY0_9ZZZZ
MSGCCCVDAWVLQFLQFPGDRTVFTTTARRSIRQCSTIPDHTYTSSMRRPRHLCLADLLLDHFDHRLLRLPGDSLFDGDGAGLLQKTFLLQKIIRRGTNVLVSLFHLVTSVILPAFMRQPHLRR